MADNSVAIQKDRPARREGISSQSVGGSFVQVPGWVSVAVGTTALAAGLASRKKGTLLLLGVAGATAVAVASSGQLGRSAGAATGNRQGKAMTSDPEVERSITIGRPADELYQRWRDPQTLTRILDGFATARSSGNGRVHWRVAGSLGRAYEWDSETMDDRPGESIGWRSLEGAAVPNEGSVRFHPAPANRGTVATLRFRFDPPTGAIGDAAVKLLGSRPLDLAADGVLRRFKSLVETGEIPTTQRQPAARADTR